jgi:hypothetical protein
VLSAALALFLVVFALMSARVVIGTDPGLPAGPQAHVVTTKSGKTILRTTASGRIVREALPATAVRSGAPLVTRASGAQGESDG